MEISAPEQLSSSKRGPKPKALENLRRKRIYVLFTEAEYVDVLSRATTAGLRIPDFIRKKIGIPK